MPKAFIQAPPDKVFEAMSDLTRHAKWAVHELKIEPVEEGPPKVGSAYRSAHVKAKAPDQVTVTELLPNERFGFHVVMPNGWEVQHTMTATSQADGTLVTRTGSMTKLPALMFLMKLLMPLLASGAHKKFLNNMKSELEQSPQ